MIFKKKPTIKNTVDKTEIGSNLLGTGFYHSRPGDPFIDNIIELKKAFGEINPLDLEILHKIIDFLIDREKVKHEENKEAWEENIKNMGR